MHMSFHRRKKGNLSVALKNAARWRECVEVMKEVYLEVSVYGNSDRCFSRWRVLREIQKNIRHNLLFQELQRTLFGNHINMFYKDYRTHKDIHCF